MQISNFLASKTMKAIVCERYGSPDILEIKEVDKPIPGDHEILIRTFATTVTSGDWRVRSLNVPTGFRLIMRLVLGFSRPRQPILGSELAGVVESVGKSVRKFKVDDRVFAFSDAAMGCHAEYKCMAEGAAVAMKPRSLSFSQAATLSFGGTTALDFLRRGKVKSGDVVLINGASGAVGTAAVQLAKHLGATVIGVCSTANAELVLSLGASRVIDYTREDFCKNGETYDVIVDTVGSAPFSRCKAALKEGGRLLAVLAGLPEMLKIPWVSMTNSRRVIAGPAMVRVEDLHLLANLAELGTLQTVIDRRYDFEQIVAAHRYVETGRKKGSVVINLVPDD